MSDTSTMTSAALHALDRAEASVRVWETRAFALVLAQVAALMVTLPAGHVLLHIAEGIWRAAFFGSYLVLAFSILAALAALFMCPSGTARVAIMSKAVRGGQERGGSEHALALDLDAATRSVTGKLWLFAAAIVLYLGGLGLLGLAYVRYGERMIQ